ncbi:MAG TPA: HEAT repeat domain-containing protein [Kamptonema sp.]|nr:HEAT repeat domain-containing protein [Kamptonema sp.]
MILLIALVSFMAGLALAYWLLEKRLQQQKLDQSEQTRRIAEEIERSHQSRMQETIQSMQMEQENRLRQITEELDQVHNSRLQETIQSLQVQHDTQLIQVTDELQKNYESQMQSAVQSLQEQHQSELKQTTDELQANEAKMQATISELQQQYESQLFQATEELARNYEAQKQSAINRLQAEYENNLRLAAEQSEAHEAQIQGNIRVLQTHYENQLKQAREELETNEAHKQEAVRMLQKHYESQLGQNDVVEFAELATPIANYSVPASSEHYEAKPQIFNDNPNSVIQELGNKIGAWGNARQISFVPQLMGYANHQSAEIRKAVALGLGKIAAANSLRAEMQRSIPILGKLSRDLEPQVRLLAVEALGAIKSDKVIPFLQQALRDTDRNVAKSASAALSKFRYYPAKSTVKAKDFKLKKTQR